MDSNGREPRKKSMDGKHLRTANLDSSAVTNYETFRFSIDK